LPENVLVIHARGGEVTKAGMRYRSYVQNPLSFYQGLIPSFSKTILVSEPGDQNPIVDSLRQDPRVEYQSSSTMEDFATLLRARHLALGGVGTFAMAAALCSPHLHTLYSSDRILGENLNAQMIRAACVKWIPLGDSYPNIGEWDNNRPDLAEMMLNYQIPSFCLSN
jgi:hypothetical protein